MSAEPDDLDRLIVEQLQDPEFARAWLASQARYERQIRDAAYRRAAADIAHRIRRELVCCDVYDRDQGTNRAGRTHAICFWGEAGARLAEATGRGETVEPFPPGASYCAKCREWDMHPEIAPRCPSCGQPWTGIAGQPEPATAHESFTELHCTHVEGPHPRHTWSHKGEPCGGHVCPGERWPTSGGAVDRG
jgi:hypothetical protein